MICDDCYQEITLAAIEGSNGEHHAVYVLVGNDHAHAYDCRDSYSGDHTPARCLDDGGDQSTCEGSIELRYSPFSQRSWPRCAKHEDEQWKRYDDSIARYADSDCVPEWFSEEMAGERWSDDY
jgi:hypothetical protein